MMKLSLSEIGDWRIFEQLVADFLRKIGESTRNSITHVEVKLGGKGRDGGIDMLVILKISDTLAFHEKKWVVQCKFLEKDIAKSHLATINIPSLIHEHGADGYLLVCKKDVTSGITEMFDNFNKNCRFGYKYEIITGEEFLRKLKKQEVIIEQYFPKYANFAFRNR